MDNLLGRVWTELMFNLLSLRFRLIAVPPVASFRRKYVFLILLCSIRLPGPLRVERQIEVGEGSVA